MDGVIGDDARLPDGDSPGVQVDVNPAEPQEFTAPHPGGRCQQPSGVVAILPDVREESAQLRWRPHL
jgi:hypothetical protein